MNVVDSSAWLEYFGDGPNAEDFAAAIEDPDDLVVPSLTLYEVYKRTLKLKDETAALDAVGAMLLGEVVELTATLAIDAARASIEHGLPMADSVILTTAHARRAVLWTQDAHFAGLADVEYRESRGTSG